MDRSGIRPKVEGRADAVGKDIDANLVVIEYKHGLLTKKDITQITKYMKGFERELKHRSMDVTVRGILVGTRANEKFWSEAKLVPRLTIRLSKEIKELAHLTGDQSIKISKELYNELMHSIKIP